MSIKTIAITGITGNQGRSIANAFVSEPGWKIRGITSDHSKPSARQWLNMGVELAAADLNSVDSLKAAFQGVNVVYGLTDMWQYVHDPPIYEQAAREGRLPIEIAFDREVAQGKKLVDAVVANIGTLDRFIFASLSDTKRFSGNTITFNLPFDSKVAIIEYLKSTYPELWQKTSLLQQGMSFSDWKTGMGTPRKGDDGVYKWSLPISGDVSIPFVDPVADTGNLVKALVYLPAGIHLVAAGSRISLKEYVALWGRLHGVQAVFERQDPAVLEEIMGSWGRALVAMFEYIEFFSYDGKDAEVVYPWDLPVYVRMTSAEEYILNENWSSVL